MEACLAGWLVTYGVHRIHGITSLDLARVVAAFARRLFCPKQLASAQVKNEFTRLESFFRTRLPSLQTRRIDSLTSKALWCCYPDSVPILDNFAERALQTLSRMQWISVWKRRKVATSTLSDAWFALSNGMTDVLAKVAVENGTSPARVLDNFLWWLGQDGFETRDAA